MYEITLKVAKNINALNKGVVRDLSILSIVNFRAFAPESGRIAHLFV